MRLTETKYQSDVLSYSINTALENAEFQVENF